MQAALTTHDYKSIQTKTSQYGTLYNFLFSKLYRGESLEVNKNMQHGTRDPFHHEQHLKRSVSKSAQVLRHKFPQRALKLSEICAYKHVTLQTEQRNDIMKLNPLCSAPFHLERYTQHTSTDLRHYTTLLQSHGFGYSAAQKQW